MAMYNCHLSQVKHKQVLRHFYYTSGRHYWEVLAEYMTESQDVVIGIAPSEAFETGAVEEVVGYTANGMILHSGVEVCRARSFTTGDTVGVCLDMNIRKVAFFLNDEVQLDTREADKVMLDDNETAHDGVVQDDHDEEVVEMKAPAYIGNTRKVAWFSFQSRTVFAAIAFSSTADKFIVMGSELPNGF